jgi:cobalt-precorrin 5A hydrolase
VTDLVILTLTPRGLELARRIRQRLGAGSIVDAAGSTRQVLEKTFSQQRPMVCIMALGIVVRALGPVLQGKESDPPVVVVDEAGKFAISVLGGHAGGANKLATEVAAAVGATPVITTASEVLQIPAVDLIGKAWGWKIENRENLTRVAAAVVQGQPVAVYQDAGRPDWWQSFGSWPHNFERLTAWPTEARWSALLVISDRLLPEVPADLVQRTVIYRPPSLTLGVGSRRGVSPEEVEACLGNLFAQHRLSTACVTALASVSLKKNEQGLIDFAEHRQIPFLTYAPDKLALVGPPPTPSARVRSKIGVAGVCEPAAMLAAGVRELVVTKTIFKRLTLAVARRPRA